MGNATKHNITITENYNDCVILQINDKNYFDLFYYKISSIGLFLFRRFVNYKVLFLVVLEFLMFLVYVSHCFCIVKAEG